MEKFFKEIKEVCKKHGITNAAICGKTEDDKFIGLLNITDKETYSALFDSITMVGRLWQHAREMSKEALDDFER